MVMLQWLQPTAAVAVAAAAAGAAFALSDAYVVSAVFVVCPPKVGLVMVH